MSGEVPPVSDASVQTLTSLAKDFEELAHTCLLVLHLEVCGNISAACLYLSLEMYFLALSENDCMGILYITDWTGYVFLQ